MSETIRREHWHIYGLVQGVGFRYGMLRVANSLSITGWVKNNPDGDVEAEVQGPLEQLDILLERLKEGRYYDIEKVNRMVIPLVGNEKKFDIKF